MNVKPAYRCFGVVCSRDMGQGTRPRSHVGAYRLIAIVPAGDGEVGLALALGM